MSLNKKTLLNRVKKDNPPPKGRWKSHKACPIETIQEMARLRISNNEIARYLGINVDTLADNFSDVLAKARIEGDKEILKAQMNKAVGTTDKGDSTLLVHLGKCRLKQGYEPEPTSEKSLVKKLFEKWDEDAKSAKDST